MKRLNKIINLYNKYKEVINYLIFGFLTTVVSLVVYYVLTFTVLEPENTVSLQIANVLSWVASVVFAYVTNRKYVFNSKSKNIIKEMGSFFGARIVTLLMDMFIMFIGVTVLRGNDRILKIISQVVIIISNYVFSKLFVFKKR